MSREKGQEEKKQGPVKEKITRRKGEAEKDKKKRRREKKDDINKTEVSS
jgi:hypothetical protein